MDRDIMLDWSDDDQLATVEEVAELVRLSPWTIYRRKDELGLPYIKIGGAVRMRIGSLKAWLEAQESTSPA